MKAKTKIADSLSWRNILVPIDFSKNARQALHYAIPLAAQSGARILLLHVLTPIVYPAEMGVVVPDEKRTLIAARKHLADLSRKFIPENLRGKVEVKAGQPSYEISEMARRLKVDLIVLTTHGYTGLTRILLGGTAERIVRHAPCPVLTVRALGTK